MRLFLSPLACFTFSSFRFLVRNQRKRHRQSQLSVPLWRGEVSVVGVGRSAGTAQIAHLAHHLATAHDVDATASRERTETATAERVDGLRGGVTQHTV